MLLAALLLATTTTVNPSGTAPLCAHCTLLAQAEAVPGREELTPPPILDAPAEPETSTDPDVKKPLRRPAAPQQTDALPTDSLPTYPLDADPHQDEPWQLEPLRTPSLQLRAEDPNLGKVVSREVLYGTLAILGSDVVAGAAVYALLTGVRPDGLPFAVFAAIAHLVLSPAYAALAVRFAAEEPTRNDLGGAILGAYSGLGAILLSIQLLSYGAVLFQAVGSGELFGIALLVTAGLARWLGVPYFSSWALHRRPGKPIFSAERVSASPHRQPSPIAGGTPIFVF